MAGTVYKPTVLLLRSKGIQARDAMDRVVEHGYLNMAGCLEREESAISSRFGNIIVNRDAAGTGVLNYLFTSAPVTLTRLRSLTSQVYRYAALADGSLWRRATDVQGAYTKILNAGTLSGLPFTSLVTTMYESSQPYLLLCDGKQMFKDNGILLAPQQLGIFGPLMPAISAAYAPGLNVLSIFQTTGTTPGVPTGTFTAGDGLVIGAFSFVVSFTGGYFGPQLGGDHFMYTWSSIPDTPCLAPDGAFLAASGSNGVKFNSDSYDETFHFVSYPYGGPYTAINNFQMPALSTTTPSSSNGTLSFVFTAPINLSNYNPADLIVIVMRVLAPGNVSSVSVNFDVAGSNYTSSYYTKTITPVSYQGFISNPLSTDAVTALTDAVLLQSLTGSATTTPTTTPTTSSTPTPTSTSTFTPSPWVQGQVGKNNLASTVPATNPITSNSSSTPNAANTLANQIAQLVPPTLASNGAWSAIYLQKGDFLPVGNANTPGLDWTVITGFQIAIVTNTDGGTEVDFNSLYIQGSPTATGVGTNAGPSSYGGVGYDFRYIYYNAATGTPSNPSNIQLFAQTPLNPGETSTLIVLRQAIDIVGQYSPDTQVTHVKLFVRGGLYGDNWRYVDLIPNLPLSTPTETIAFISVSGTTVTITTLTVNAFTPNLSIILNGLTSAPALNGQTVAITATPTPSQIQFTFIGLTPTTVIPETGTITLTPASLSAFGNSAGLFSYRYILPDTALQQGEILGLANDVPVTSSLQSPINSTLTTPVQSIASPNINYPTFTTVGVAGGLSVSFVANQIIVVGNTSNLEQVIAVRQSTGGFTAWFQYSHAIGEPVQAFAIPAQPVPLSAIAYGTVWYAGDTNNPHYLYYANKGYGGECVSPQNYIPCGTPSDPIVLVVNKRGTLFVSTLSTWYQIFPGNPPYAQSTGSKHGAVASFGWGDAEGELYYEAADGIRTFKGSDGTYKSLPIEWLWRDNPLTPIPLIDTTQLSKILGAYVNSEAIFVYIGQDGNRHRLIWSSEYSRWRNDDVPATALYLEADTNTLVYSIPITIPGLGGGSGWVIVYDSYSQDYDDGGWSGGILLQNPIPITLQTPYLDVGAPNNQKQFNVLTIDANPNGQILTPTLLFDGNNGNVATVIPSPATFTGAVRNKFVFQIAAGFGQQAYEISLQITGAVTAAPILYQAEMYAAVLADQRSSYDTYWVTLSNTNETKLVKQCFVDYTTIAGNTLLLQIFADGNLTPYFTIVLPENTSRSEVPMRVRFPAKILRLFRMIITSTAKYQLWSPVQLMWKMNATQSGFQRLDLGDTTP